MGIPVAVTNAGLYRLGLDGILADNEKKFIDTVAAKPSLKVQHAMASSPYVLNRLDKGGLEAAVKADDTLKNYGPEIQEAIWSMPDKDLDLSGADISFVKLNFNPSSLLEAIVQNDAKVLAVLGAQQRDIYGNVAFLNAVDNSKWPLEKLTAFDVTQWPVEPRQALFTVSYFFDSINYLDPAVLGELGQTLDLSKFKNPEGVLDKVLDRFGVYPGVCIYCDGKTWNLLIDNWNAPNGGKVYSGIVASPEHARREMIKGLGALVKAGDQCELSKPFAENKDTEYGLFFRRVPEDAGGNISTSYTFMNGTSMNTSVYNGNLLTTWSILRTMVFGAEGALNPANKLCNVSEEATVNAIADWSKKNFVHMTSLPEESTVVTMYRVFKDISTNPTNPKIGEAFVVKKGGSPTVLRFMADLAMSAGLPAETMRPDVGNTLVVYTDKGAHVYCFLSRAEC